MASFIPSYFQKRLLRYALTRLDFIETDDLDLENLDLTLGQRSVIELKNVSIRVNKLTERVDLPPYVLVRAASIRCLRIVVPADLHASGIEAVIEGVDISIQIRGDEPARDKNPSRIRRHAAPSHTDQANRPRLSSPPVHDPGGSRAGRHHGLDISHVLPTSEDLAASFLQSEPLEERQELEAAIGSQSHMQDSATSSAYGDDAGLGMPGGFALPAFVANFFHGIADRLSVKIKDISILIELSFPASQPDDSARLVLRVGMVDVGSLKTPDSLSPSSVSNRVVSVENVRFGIEADNGVWSQSSSPKLSRAQSQFSSSAFNDSASREPYATQDRTRLQDSRRGVSPTSDNDSVASSVEFPPTFDLGIDRSFEETEDPAPSIQGVELHYTEFESTVLSGPFDIDNKAHAEQVAPPVPSNASSPDTSRSSQHGRDLSESTLFSHEQAESMYMSAVSQGTTLHSRSRVMPGGWDWSDGVQDQGQMDDRLPSPPSEGTATETPTLRPLRNPTNAQNSSGEVFAEKRPEPTQGDRAQGLDVAIPSQLPFTQLLHLDTISVTVPERIALQSSDSREPAVSVNAAPLRSTRPTAQSHAAGERSMAANAVADNATRKTDESSHLELSCGVLTIDLDLQVSKLLVRVLQAFMKILPSAPPPEKASNKSAENDLKSPALRMQKVLINLRETLNPAFRKEGAGLSDSPILCLSVLSVVFVEESVSRKKLTVSKISVNHGAKDVMWFIDSVNVRDSIASSLMLRPNDLTVTMTDRIEVQIKPAYIVMDLIRIDDVLSRSGGLSSLIDLGNSIISTNTVTATSPTLPKARHATRSVRFDAPERRSRADSDPYAPGPKINVRLSGAIIDLVGSEASIQVKTSAVKVASRSGNARVVIDGAAVEGPILHNSKSPAGVYAKMKSLEIVYSETPEEADLDRLVTLITPSSDKYDDDDDIMIDTLLRQRRKGGVLNLNLKDIQIVARGIDWQQHFTKLSDELANLSTVAKYLPEDDRPGILTFALIQKFEVQCHADDIFGILTLRTDLIEGAYINVPSLAAAKVDTWSLRRGKDDILIGEVLRQEMGAPMIMCRFIADEMEPTVRLKLSNNCVEYKVPTLIAITELLGRLEGKSGISRKRSPPRLSPTSSSSSDTSNLARRIKVSVVFRHSAIALHPLGSPAKGLFLLSDTVLSYETLKKSPNITLELRKASLLVINNAEILGSDKNVDHKLYFDQNDQVRELARSGFVPVATISAAVAVVKILQDEMGNEQHVDVEFKKNLLILETCADSTQTMVQILSGLSPPAPPSKVAKYRTEIVPIDDMLASFTGNAFVSEPGPDLGLRASHMTASMTSDDEEDDIDGGYMKDLYMDEGETDDEMTASYVESDLARSTVSTSLHIAPVEANAPEEDALAQSMIAHSMLDFRNDHFAPKSNVGGTAHRWDSAKNTYELGSEAAFQRSPLKVRVRDMHVIWNMFDGFDWQSTRDTITQAVQEIETRAITKRSRARASSPIDEDEEESVIGDVLFNSIYISIPARQDPAELARAINHDIDDQVSETSYATRTTITASPSRRQSYRRTPTLKLNRSKQHKMSIELQGVSADIVAFPPGSGEVESSVDVRINKLEIFDHVPTSTWKKFATYMHDAGEREVDTSQVHIELLNVKPVAELAASEIVLKATVLPLRLHVDQDALDFISRFFEFKDENASTGAAPTPPFLQRVEVNPIRLRLDYKPKTVDYASLRSGRTTEFMNFIVLDRADMVLRRVILYGVPGFERMGLMLNNIWMPDVKRNQLPGVLAGLAPIRPVVDVARGVNELIAVPIREYQKDGRIVRALQKGAIAFAKTTSTELANLGAKLAIGTQNVLQNAEDMLAPAQLPRDENEDEEKKQISLYADQPVGIVQGLRGAYASLERDLLLARDAIVAVPGEVMAQPNAKGAAKAILKQSPTIILRPAMGVSKAAAQTFQGVANTLDRGNLRRIEDKYKRH